MNGECSEFEENKKMNGVLLNVKRAGFRWIF